jgi:hypothetical protein
MTNYFIHDDAIKAIKYLYPNLEHGVDFLVLMGIEQGRKWIPASDAWIEWWDVEVSQPSIEHLKQVFIDNDLGNVELVNQQPESTGTQEL